MQRKWTVKDSNGDSITAKNDNMRVIYCQKFPVIIIPF